MLLLQSLENIYLLIFRILLIYTNLKRPFCDYITQIYVPLTVLNLKCSFPVYKEFSKVFFVSCNSLQDDWYHWKRSKIENVSKEDLEHFFFSLAQNLNCCIHVTVKYGDNDHHKVEAAIKSMAVAIRNAVSNDPKQKGIPSTKGAM